MGSSLANNALYCAGGTAIRWGGDEPGISVASLAGNVVLGGGGGRGASAGASVAEDLGDPSRGLVYPPAGSSLIGAADPAQAAADDFNAAPRDDGAPDVGAYERSVETNPGWMIGEGFKDVPMAPPPEDAGASPDAGGPDAGAGSDAGDAAPDVGGMDTGADDGGGGGCGCVAAGSSDVATWLLLLMLFARRHHRPV